MLLIRHASAGERTEWVGDDRLRPIDKRGREQAQRLVDLLREYRVERVISSPYDRCIQTVQPLAASRGLDVVPCEELSEEEQGASGAALVRRLADEPVAACCHGGLAEAVTGEAQKKGETFVLRRDGDGVSVVERIRA